jgi:sugar O-acyltransferase (sialic acid O-acetyltransferase NeuD family)
MNKRRVLLLAAGGHGSVVLDALLASGTPVSGIIDPGMSVGSALFDVPVLGGDAWLEQANPDDVLLVNGIGANPFKNLRGLFFSKWNQRGFKFLSVQHPSTVVGREAVLSEGSQIMAGSIVQCRVSIADNVVINTRASVDHDCKIGAHAFIGPGVTLCGDVCIGDNAFIGAGAIVLPGVRVGSNAVVGAGAVVTRDIRCGELVAGNPATPKPRRLP